MRRSIPQEVVVSSLGIAVELGKEKFIKSIPDGEMFFNYFLAIVDENILLHDPHFLFSIYLASLNADIEVEKTLKRELKRGELFAPLKIRLDEIFPKDLSDKIFEYFLHNGGEIAVKIKDQNDWEAAVTKHLDYKKKLWHGFSGSRDNPSLKTRKMGNETWLVPCPLCG